MYVRDFFTCKRRADLEIHGLEAVWLELQVQSKQILVGGFYRPPNSGAEYFNLVVESIDRAHNTNITDLIILGDFNYNMLTNDNNKIRDTMLHYNLSQVIKDATHFTENSSSLIDLILLRNTANMLTSGVIDNFLPDQIRYHCPIIVLLKFLRPSVKTYKRRVWLYPQADFTRYRELLSEYNFEEDIERNTDLEHNVKYITNALIEASEKSIPNKIVTIRPKDHPWITCRIRNLIRKRKRIFRKYKKTYDNNLRDKFKAIRNKVVNEIRKSKKEYFDKLEQLLSNESASSKISWKTSKQILNLNKHQQIYQP